MTESRLICILFHLLVSVLLLALSVRDFVSPSSVSSLPAQLNLALSLFGLLSIAVFFIYRRHPLALIPLGASQLLFVWWSLTWLGGSLEALWSGRTAERLAQLGGPLSAAAQLPKRGVDRDGYPEEDEDDVHGGKLNSELIYGFSAAVISTIVVCFEISCFVLFRRSFFALLAPPTPVTKSDEILVSGPKVDSQDDYAVIPVPPEPIYDQIPGPESPLSFQESVI